MLATKQINGCDKSRVAVCTTQKLLEHMRWRMMAAVMQPADRCASLSWQLQPLLATLPFRCGDTLKCKGVRHFKFLLSLLRGNSVDSNLGASRLVDAVEWLRALLCLPPLSHLCGKGSETGSIIKLIQDPSQDILAHLFVPTRLLLRSFPYALLSNMGW